MTNKVAINVTLARTAQVRAELAQLQRDIEAQAIRALRQAGITRGKIRLESVEARTPTSTGEQLGDADINLDAMRRARQRRKEARRRREEQQVEQSNAVRQRVDDQISADAETRLREDRKLVQKQLSGLEYAENLYNRNIRKRRAAQVALDKAEEKRIETSNRIRDVNEKGERKLLQDEISRNRTIDRLQKKNAREKAAAAKRRDREMSQMTMGLASAGIGIFGQAGFPLLNVAFASMSGMKYAGIAAVATAAGEAARFIGRLQDSAFQAADSLKLLTTGFKEARAEFEAVKGAYGVMLQPSMQRRLQANIDFLQSSQGTYLTSLSGNLRTEFLSTKFFTDLMGRGKLENLKTAIFPGKLWMDPLGRALQGAKTDQANAVELLREARNNMVRESLQYKASFQSPEEQWRRMQAAAMSTGDESRKLLLKQIEKLDEIIRELQRTRTEDQRQIEEMRSMHTTTGGRVNIGAEALLYQ